MKTKSEEDAGNNSINPATALCNFVVGAWWGDAAWLLAG